MVEPKVSCIVSPHSYNKFSCRKQSTLFIYHVMLCNVDITYKISGQCLLTGMFCGSLY